MDIELIILTFTTATIVFIVALLHFAAHKITRLETEIRAYRQQEFERKYPFYARHKCDDASH